MILIIVIPMIFFSANGETLRCYQCDTETMDHWGVCSLKTWMHANRSVKFDLVMQCPGWKAAFCYLMVNNNGSISRGCAGPTLSDGMKAHMGCMNMGEKRRFCLCNTNLCNTAGMAWNNNYALVTLYLFSVMFYYYSNL
uniref:Protein quiver n=1 Tax=Clastoptera arizonana TaxID=38151 RepID=A0A1B6EGV6_9HEMI